MKKTKNVLMLTEQEMSSGNTDLPQWLKVEYEIFSNNISDPDFPCFFGTISKKRSEIRYTFIEEDDYSLLPKTLISFLETSRTDPNIRQNLAVFFKPEKSEKSLEFYRDKVWNVLNYLHENDSRPWPENVPYDPQHRSWEFCYNGEPVFVFAASPAYIQRRSRNYGNSLILIFQPTRLFNGLECDSPEGIRVRKIIRSRLIDWDRNKVNIPPDSSKLGGEREYYWKQYIISDDNEPIKGSCPFHIKDKF